MRSVREVERCKTGCYISPKSISKKEFNRFHRTTDVESAMQTRKVQGKHNTHRVLLYAISTCGWCRKAKGFLADNSIAYEYVDVDLCSEKDREEVYRDIERRGGRPSFPVIIVDGQTPINGFHEDKIREALGI